jgi:ubiquinone/menaquinone biosynthesis C-methylase UbiE
MFETASSYKDIFNKRADSYHKAMLQWPNARNEEFQALLEDLNISNEHKVVDIPAGGGYLSWYIKQAQIHHIETSQVFAQLCHSKSPHPLTICELNQLPFDDNSIDYVLSLAGLHHTEDKSDLFQQINRILKPGGHCILADARKGSKTAIFLDGWMAQNNSMGHKGWYFDQLTEDELASSGLSISKVESKDYHWNFASITQAAKYCQLMFGIDKASLCEIEEALMEHLGGITEETSFSLNWQLEFISCYKQDTTK